MEGNNTVEELFNACKDGNITKVKQILNDGCTSDILNFSTIIVSPKDWRIRSTVLHAAVQSENIEIIRELLKYPIDVNVKDSQGDSPLSYACKKGNIDIVNELLTKPSIDVNAIGPYYSLDGSEEDFKNPPLRIALADRHLDIATILFDDIRIDPNVISFKGTPLQEACYRDNSDVLQLILSRNGIDVNASNSICKKTPLMIACKKRNETAVKLLLEDSRLDPSKEISTTLDRSAPLRCSDQIFNPDDRVEGNFTALCIAAFFGHGNICELLLKDGRFKPSEFARKHISGIDEKPLNTLVDNTNSPNFHFGGGNYSKILN